MGRVRSQGTASGMKAAAKRSQLSQERRGVHVVIAKLSRQANRVAELEKELAGEREARLALERRLRDLELSLQVVIT